MFLFGLTTILQGLVQNYGGLLATRFFLGALNMILSSSKSCELSQHLGAFEAGMFAGSFYLISM